MTLGFESTKNKLSCFWEPLCRSIIWTSILHLVFFKRTIESSNNICHSCPPEVELSWPLDILSVQKYMIQHEIVAVLCSFVLCLGMLRQTAVTCCVMTGQWCADRVHQIAIDVLATAAEAESVGDGRAVVNATLAGVRNVILVNVKLRRSQSMKVVPVLLVSNTSILFMCSIYSLNSAHGKS